MMKTLLGYNLTSVNMTPRERKRIRHPCRVDGWYSCFAAYNGGCRLGPLCALYWYKFLDTEAQEYK